MKDEELKVAIEKTKEEQVEKAVVNAIKKAGVNPNLVDSEDHIESNIKKGWLTPEDAEKAREIRAKVGAEKAANLPEQMVQNIAKGRLNKFFKESCLVDQEFQFGDGDKLNVAQWLQARARRWLSATTVATRSLLSNQANIYRTTHAPQGARAAERIHHGLSPSDHGSMTGWG